MENIVKGSILVVLIPSIIFYKSLTTKQQAIYDNFTLLILLIYIFHTFSNTMVHEKRNNY